MIPLSGQLFLLDLATASATTLHVPSPVIDARFTADGAHLLYVRDFNLQLFDLHTGEERALTQGGESDLFYGLAEFVAQEEMERMRGYWLSADGLSVVYARVDNHNVETLSISDPAQAHNPAQTFRYPRAGNANADVQLLVRPLSPEGKAVAIEWNREQFPYVVNVVWSQNAPLTLVVQSRDQRTLQILKVQSATGRTTLLHEERESAWLNIVPSMPQWLSDGSGFLWMSESQNRWQIALHDAHGALRSVVVPHTLHATEFLKLVHTHSHQYEIFYLTSADGVDNQLAHTTLSLSEGQVSMSHAQAQPSQGARSIVLSKSGYYRAETTGYFDAWSRTAILEASGNPLIEIAAPKSLQALPKPHIEQTRTGGALDMNALIIRPHHFKAGSRYPVILSVYGGPRHNMVVPGLEAYLKEQWFADHGYIVVMIDGRGTEHRGREFERAIHTDFAKTTVEDQVTGLKALAHHYPELDLTRVGVKGWSFGGYLSALALMLRPDVFHSAIAGAPVVDWMDYDTHYTERYLNRPQENPKGYERSNLLTHAPALQRPLLLIHGIQDDNVYFLHSLKLMEALFKAGKSHLVNFVPLNGATHMVPYANGMAGSVLEMQLRHFENTLKTAPTP